MSDFMTEVPTEDAVLESDSDFTGRADSQTDGQEEEEPAESSTEKTPEDDNSPSPRGERAKEPDTEDESNKPLHKTKRWQERETEWQDRFRSQELKMAELEASVKAGSSPAQTEEIPEWFSGLYGDDADKWNNYRRYEKSQREAIKRELFEEQRAAQEQQNERAKQWERYKSDSLARLKDDGKSFDPKELDAVMEKWRPTDDKGNWDFSKGYEILQLSKQGNKDTAKTKKNIANLDGDRPSSEASPKDYMTQDDFRGKSIYDLVN